MTHSEFRALPPDQVTLEETRRQIASALDGRPWFRDLLEASILGYLLDGTYERCMEIQRKWAAAGSPGSDALKKERERD